jgi:DNA-directed RNA polymerase specialized sigma subunit
MEQIHGNMSLADAKRRISMRSNIEDYADRIKCLTVARQLLFSMYFIHGYSMYQIGALLRISESSVSRRIRTIVRQVQRKSKPEHF